MARQISLIIVGAGDRGQLYADLAARDPRVRIAAVADPDEGRRTTLAERHAVPSTRRYSDWRDVIEQPRIADAAVIATTGCTMNLPWRWPNTATTSCLRSP